MIARLAPVKSNIAPSRGPSLASYRSCLLPLALFALVALPTAAAARNNWVVRQIASQPLEASLHEAVHTVAVPGTGATIVVTSYRPDGPGPHPWLLLSHGTAPTLEANRHIGRYRNPTLIREWTRRGYAVVVPVRRGYGASGGPKLGDGWGSCRHPDFGHAGEEAARDLLAAVAWAKSQPDLDPARWLLVGQSAGGFASIYTASKQSSGLVAVLAFSAGRAANPATRKGNPCAQDKLAAVFAEAAPKIKVPVLWFYAENDELVGKEAPKLWYGSFRAAGGVGDLVVIPPFPDRQGHGVFPSPAGIPLWTAAVAKFYHDHQIGLPF